MTDIPDTQLVALGISVLAAWFMGFYFGKLAGRQQTEKHQQETRRMQQALREERNKRR
jgi:hypothetical protein